MRTWSAIQVAEGVLGGAILAAQKLVDAGIAVAGCFRRLGSDWDTTLEGPEWLAEREAEEEVAEPPADEWEVHTYFADGHVWCGKCRYPMDWHAAGRYIHAINGSTRCPDAASVVPPQQMPDADGDASPEPSPSASPTWVEWSVPAICTVLADHFPAPQGDGSDIGWYVCEASDGSEHGQFIDQQDWLEHVAPLIAARLERATLAEFPKK